MMYATMFLLDFTINIRSSTLLNVLVRSTFLVSQLFHILIYDHYFENKFNHAFINWRPRSITSLCNTPQHVQHCNVTQGNRPFNFVWIMVALQSLSTIVLRLTWHEISHLIIFIMVLMPCICDCHSVTKIKVALCNAQMLGLCV